MMFAALTAVAEERDRYLYALEQARWDIRLLYASVALSPETDLGLRYLYADLDAVLSEQPNDAVLWEMPNDAVLSEQPNDAVLLEMPNDAVLSEQPKDAVLLEMPNDAVLSEQPNADAIPLPPVPAGFSKVE
ncbi:MAG: hypothetical protein ABWZ13_08105 [Acidimicrobiales bacterium]